MDLVLWCIEILAVSYLFPPYLLAEMLSFWVFFKWYWNFEVLLMLNFSSVLPTPKIACHMQNFLKWFFAFASFVLAAIHRPDHVCRLSRQLCNTMMQNCRRDQLAVERDQMDIPRETFILGHFASIMLWHFFSTSIIKSKCTSNQFCC